MTHNLSHFLTLLTLAVTLTACSASPTSPALVSPSQAAPIPAEITAPDLPVDATWQIQYSGELDLSLDVDVYNLDLIETTLEDIAALHDRNIYVMCYFSAGSWEDWRSDADSFPEEIIGEDYAGWPGENWLDIRAIDELGPILEARLQLAADKGCDGVDPDNVNGFENETGFSLSYTDQLDFNLWLADAAHSYGLDIGLKNDLNQISDLVAYFDWILNEECFSYDECELLTPFREAGKPVFVIEYETPPADFCPQADELGFNTIYKNWELDAYWEACP